MNRTPTRSELVMPILSPGRHRTPRKGACFMEFASYLAGEHWSDHPACTHPVLAALARDVNDLSSATMRSSLVTHIPRVVGLNSDDPYVGTAIAVYAACAALPVASLERQRALSVGIMNAVQATGSPELQDAAAAAFALAPDAHRWARTFLPTVLTQRRFDTRTAISMVHTAVVGIAHACVSDTDARLRAVLLDAIDLVESVVAHPAVESTEAPGSETEREASLSLRDLESVEDRVASA